LVAIVEVAKVSIPSARAKVRHAAIAASILAEATNEPFPHLPDLIGLDKSLNARRSA
jgi:hypothetical protein